jgi:hypothetical protein
MKILMAYSNAAGAPSAWHARRIASVRALGYDFSAFNMSDYHPYTVFPYLDRLWKKRDPRLMRLYDALGPEIDKCDLFIHYSGALIHPAFLDQFRKLKVYHCADDPDASSTLSRPVARHYDICAISNPTCIDLYRSWGCRHVFFWPIGAFNYVDGSDNSPGGLPFSERDIPVLFIGSKLGVPKIRFIGKYLNLFVKSGRMKKLERAFPDLIAYGWGWRRGRAADEDIAPMYRRTQVGFNLHNTTGPINGRLYDLAAFGCLQVCDNKRTLDLVFEPGKEIIGYESMDECIDLIRYYLAHPDEAQGIGRAARARYLRDYNMTTLWLRFFSDVDAAIGPTPKP